MHIKVAFVGNPNCGKTTLFNAYTGAKHKVGNWAGVTVEKKEGIIKHDGHTITLVDLPGIYSLSPYSMEEILTREFILNDNPDVVVNIVDASNLERNLFLTLQLIELGKPVIIALNMMDIVQNRGYTIEINKLSEKLGIPIIPISAVKRSGLIKLLHQIIRTTKVKDSYVPIKIQYPDEIEDKIINITNSFNKLDTYDKSSYRWLALKLLENDKEIIKNTNGLLIEDTCYSEEIGKSKYDFISGFINEIHQVDYDRETFSDRVDKIVTNTIFGIPIFIVMMLMVFGFTFGVGNYFAGLLEQFFSFISVALRYYLMSLHVAEWVVALITDGIFGGVGSILIFIPNIACLFLAFSILEDSGYMARVALLMDKIMSRIGLTGKAFIPMILGFGCSVPAIMTTKTLENEKERLITMLITPFMSCSARLPIYVLFSRVFFPNYEILISFSLYLLGVIVAVVIALIFKQFFNKDGKTALIMELPEYKRPSAKSVIIYVWLKSKEYLTRAGTIIFIASIIIWVILEFNITGHVDMTHSFGAYIGKALAPIFEPLGFGSWQTALALIAGIMGKEIVVSSMAVIFSAGNVGLIEALSMSGFTAISAYSFMVFSLLYTPCIATLAIIKKETRSWGWTAFSFMYQIIVAWVVAFLIYQIGTLIF